MPSKQEDSESLGAGCVFWLLAILVWLVVTYPWLLLFPIALWLCIILPNRPKKVHPRPPQQTVIPVPAPRTMVAMPPPRTTTPAPPPKVIPTPVKVAPPDFIPKDREYNRHLARTWDEEFESLVKGGDMSPEQQPAEDASLGPEQHQPLKGASSNEHVLNELDDEPAHLRRAVLARFHADVVKLHEAAKLQEARVAQSREDARQLLAGDPRTMWAWAEYVERRSSPPVRREDAQQVLAAIPPGDHVEIFGSACVSGDARPPLVVKFVARTFDSWILPSSGQKATTIPASNSSWTSSDRGSIFEPLVTESHFTLADGRHLDAYADDAVFDRFGEGAGRSILRLPDNPLAPIPPQLGTGRMLPSQGSASPGRLLSDCRTAEDVALWHMSGQLGFFGARLTGGMSDRGVDVEHPAAVAQVKMQANPVGSPQIRQLRGTRPHLRNHVFYSTSGFTRAAVVEAAETGVALFTLDNDATVRPHGSHAKRLILDGHVRHGGDDALVADYINSVTERVRKAQANYGSTEASQALQAAHGTDRSNRAKNYLKGAVDAVELHPRIGAETHKAVVSHFRNADLRAAFFCQVLDLPYPGDKPLSRRRRPSTAADFY